MHIKVRMNCNDFKSLLKISSEIINELDPINFKGNITVISSKSELPTVYDIIKKAKRIGFDTESRPSFKKGQEFPVSIIQLSLEDEAYIFKLKSLGFCDELKDILSDENIEKIGVGVKEDIRRLKKLGDFNPANFIDLAEIAKKKGLIQCGLKALTARYLCKKLVKSSQTTNWAKNSLTCMQLTYAATDAWICLQLLEPLTLDDTDYFHLRKLEEEAIKDKENNI